MSETTPLLQSFDDGSSHRMQDLRVLGLAFFFIFSAFTTITAITSTVLPPQIAFTAAGTLYVAFSVANLFAASAIVDFIGCRASLVVAALTYSVYNVANVLALKAAGDENLQSAILLPAAILNGFGASLLWAGQGVYVARISLPQTLGKYSGMFFSFMWTSGILGPIFMSILFQYNVDKIIVFELITGISLIGPCLLVFLWIARPEPSNPFALTLSEPTSPAPTDTTPSNLKTLRLVLTPTMFLILPGAFATAFEQCFFNGLLPLFIKSGDMSSDLSTKLSLRACISFVQVGSSFFVGALTDRVGSRPMVIACLGLHILCQCLLVLNSPLNNLPVLIAVYVCIGLSNSTLINQSQKLVGVSFPFQTSQAYAGYKFFTSIGAAIGFFGSKYTLGDDGLPVMRIWSPLLISLLILTCLGTFSLSK